MIESDTNVAEINTSAGLKVWAYYMNLPAAERARKKVTSERMMLFEMARKGKLVSYVDGELEACHTESASGAGNSGPRRARRVQRPQSVRAVRNTYDYVHATDLCRVRYYVIDSEIAQQVRAYQQMGQVFHFNHFDDIEDHCYVLVRCTCDTFKHYGGCVHIVLSQHLEGECLLTVLSEGHRVGVGAVRCFDVPACTRASARWSCE